MMGWFNQANYAKCFPTAHSDEQAMLTLLAFYCCSITLRLFVQASQEEEGQEEKGVQKPST